MCIKFNFKLLRIKILVDKLYIIKTLKVNKILGNKKNVNKIELLTF
jgi:hypothetical protein